MPSLRSILFLNQIDQMNKIPSMIFQHALIKSLATHGKRVAIENGKQLISYSHVFDTANHISSFLLKRKLPKETIIGIQLEDRVEIIYSIIGVVNARCVFVLLDSSLPKNRLETMIQKLGLQYVITNGNQKALTTNNGIEKFVLRDILSEADAGDESPVQYPDFDGEDSLYIYFTSGSTGVPKGIVGKNCSVLQFVRWEIKEFGVSEKSRFSQLISPYFDAFLRDIFVPLLAGGTICIPPDDIIGPWIDEAMINFIHCVPSLFRIINSNNLSKDHFKQLQYVLMSGEKIIPSELKSWYKIFDSRIQLVNLYGATESTMIRSYYRISPGDTDQQRIPIGSPIDDTELLIANNELKPCSTLVPGNLYIISQYMTKGYLNDPELTSQKFIKLNPGTKNEKIAYKTGDIARMLPSGNIDLIGREDRQVKLRGVRIELDELELVLLRSDKLKSATSMIMADESGEEILVAFVICKDGLPNGYDIKENITLHLENNLPKFMIPSEIIQVAEFPLLSSGKIDYKTLRQFMKVERNIILPSDDVEKKVLSIWKEILGQKPISIEDGFNKVGGNSLSMMNLIGKLNRTFQVKISLAQLFENLTVKKQAAFIKQSTQDISNIIKKANTAEYYVLSSAQKRLYFLYQFDSSSLAYNMPQIVKLEGELDDIRLEDSINKLLARHESLRTSFHVVNEQPVQKIESDVLIQIERWEASERESDKIIKQFIRPFDLSIAPLIRVGLIQTALNEHIMMFDVHHIIADGVSHSLIVKDFMSYYNCDILPELKLQYKDFAVWQQSTIQQYSIARQREFWVNMYKKSIEKIELPADFNRSEIKDYKGASISFTIDKENTNKLRLIGEHEGASMFMVILSLYNILLSKLTNKEDIVIGAPFAGRQHDDLEHVIGMFVNTLPLRNDVKSGLSFNELLSAVKSTVLHCLANQDYPYEELIDELNIDRDTNRNPLFDIMLAYQNFAFTELEIEGLSLKPYSWENKEVKFDITLFAFEVDGEMVLNFEYATALFRKETIERYSTYFRKIIFSVIENSEVKISDIQVMSDAEVGLILNNFKTPNDYILTDTIVTLFEKQVSLAPGKVAIYFDGAYLIYGELNAEANQLANFLRTDCSVSPGAFVGIMLQRSEKMIVALLAILKTGAAYVPIGIEASTGQMRKILDDSGVNVLVTDSKIDLVSGFTGRVVDISKQMTSSAENTNLNCCNDPESLCYVVYGHDPTESSKGIMISHRNVINFFAGLDLLERNEETVLAVTDIIFDSAVIELFWTLCRGMEVVLSSSVTPLNNLDRYVTKDSYSVDFSLFFFSSYNNQEEDKYNLLFDSVKYADQNGFKAVWTPERHFHVFGGLYPNPSVISSALAMVTSQIELRCGSIVSPLHDSVRIAEEWSVVDNLSNGRVGLSFGSGWNVNDFVLAPDSYAERQKKMYQQIDDIRRLWKGGKISKINGLGKTVELGVFPKPIQEDLPVWITSSRSEETFRSAGAIGANLLTHLLGHDIEDLAKKIEVYRNARREHGHKAEEGKVTIMLHTYVGDDIDEVERTVEQPFMDYLKSAIGLDKIMMEESGLKEDEVSDEDKQLILKNAFARYYQKASLIGTRSSCIKMVQNLKRIGIDEIACLVDFGIEKSLVLKGLKNLNDLRSYCSGEARELHKPITLMRSTPAMLSHIESDPNSKKFLNSLRLIIIDGEYPSVSLINKLKDKHQMQLYYMYGPPEATIRSTISGLDEMSERKVVGKPLPNSRLYVLDGALKLVPIGVQGDLYIGGAGISGGYWQAPELTDTRFIPNPFVPSERMYKTGHLARWLSDYNLEILGAEGHEVELNGYKVNLKEIERCLTGYIEVREAEVVTREISGENILVAYYVADAAIDKSELRKFLLTMLPEYMVPSHFEQLTSIPRNYNGKIDTRSLSPESQAEEDVSLSGEIIEKLLDIWAEVLKLDKKKINQNKNFFKLGGHSLRALVLVNKIYKELGVKIPLKSFFAHSTIPALAKLVQASKVSEYTSISKAVDKPYYEVSYAQKAMYFLYEFDKSSLFYNQPKIMKIQGPLNKDLLYEVFSKLIKRHEIFRTSFEVINDQPVQIIAEQIDFNIEFFKSSESEVRSIFNKVIRPFDLQHAPLLRVVLVEIDDFTHYLLIDTHHIILDGTSDGILFKELVMLYNNEELPELTLQYKDYAEWQQSESRLREIEKQKGFWVSQFSDGMPALALPADFEEPVPDDQTGGSVDFTLNTEVTAALTAISEAEGASIFMGILAIYNILLSKLANQEDVLVGTLVSGREHIEIENMLGMFVVALPLRNRPEGHLSFRNFLTEVKNTTLLSFENQSYQFKSQLDESNGEKGSNRVAPFNAFYAFRNFDRNSNNKIKGLTVEEFYAGGIGESRYDINLVVSESDQGLLLSLNCSKLFKIETRQRFATYFNQIVKSIIVNPNINISKIELLTTIERKQILKDFNSTRKELAARKSFYELFTEQVKCNPSNVAAEHNGTKLTYAELHEKSLMLAAYLSVKGVKRHKKVALYMPRGLSMLTTILAVFRAGGAYIPLDFDYPQERIKEILFDSGTEIVLTTNSVEQQAREIQEQLHTIKEVVVVDLVDLKEHTVGTNFETQGPDDLVYVIYTSGTSGKPKGVMIHQLGMINHLFAKINDLSLSSDDVIAQTASACFDISVWQFLSGLLCGGKTYIIDKEKVLDSEQLTKELQEGKVSIVESVPSLLTTFLDKLPDNYQEALTRLRWMIPTGEPLHAALARKWYSHFPNVKLLNAYGPTEASDDVTHYVVPARDSGRSNVPIGKPIQNTHIFILDRYLNLCPIGVLGEICVGGLGVGKGYWNNEERTLKAFIPNPFVVNEETDGAYATLFKTGDVGYYSDNGNIVCLGRIDEQVKIRGFRIELGEIESLLLENDGVKEAAVITYSKNQGDKRLVAFIASADDAVNSISLKKVLRTKLPEYMVPSSIVKLERMPLTTNGKIDKKALVNKVSLLDRVDENFVEPRTDIERQLAQIWEDVLGVEAVGLNDTFFGLGGHSLLLIKNNQRIKSRFNVELPFRLYFNQTLEQISAELNVRLTKQNITELVESD